MKPGSFAHLQPGDALAISFGHSRGGKSAALQKVVYEKQIALDGQRIAEFLDPWIGL